MTVGIERIDITTPVNGRGSWRFDHSKARWGEANKIYKAMLPLLPGEEITGCEVGDVQSRHDIEYGVDLVLTFQNGASATIQEKILTTSYETVTCEYYQDWRIEEKGDWFNLKVDFYFVGYSPIGDDLSLHRWILLDWPRVKLYGDSIPWQRLQNEKDGARADFIHAHFNKFPMDCVIAKYLYGKLTLSPMITKRFAPQQVPIPF